MLRHHQINGNGDSFEMNFVLGPFAVEYDTHRRNPVPEYIWEIIA